VEQFHWPSGLPVHLEQEDGKCLLGACLCVLGLLVLVGGAGGGGRGGAGVCWVGAGLCVCVCVCVCVCHCSSLIFKGVCRTSYRSLCFHNQETF